MGALHPRYLATWTLVGAAATVLDRLHAGAGITTYPDPEWVGAALPVSPVYAAAGLFGYVGWVLLVGRGAAPRGFLGGAPIGPRRALLAVLPFVLAYAATALLSAKGLEDGPWPWACGALLAATAAPSLVRHRRTGLPVFAVAATVVAVGFEALAASRGAFAYGICPSSACLGAPVAVAWLPWLYVHAALCVHGLLAEEPPGAREP